MKYLLIVLMLAGSISAESWMCKERKSVGISTEGEKKDFNLEAFILTHKDSTITLKRFGDKHDRIYPRCESWLSKITCYRSIDGAYASVLSFNKYLKRVTILKTGSWVQVEGTGDDDTVKQANCLKI